MNSALYRNVGWRVALKCVDIVYRYGWIYGKNVPGGTARIRCFNILFASSRISGEEMKVL